MELVPHSVTAVFAKMEAFDDYLQKWDIPHSGFAVKPNNEIVVYFENQLTEAQHASLAAYAALYTDPEFFLRLSFTRAYTAVSDKTSSPIPKPVQTFIFAYPLEDSDVVLDACKTIVEYHAIDVAAFTPELLAAHPQPTALLEIHDISRNVLIGAVTVDIHDILQAWADKAANNESGPNSIYRTAILSGLRDDFPKYDCVCQVRLAVSCPNVKVRTHSLQYLFYNVL